MENIDNNLIEMGNCAFVRMMSKVLNNPNGKTFDERLLEEFIPFAKVLLDEYEKIKPIKFNAIEVELYNYESDKFDDKTFKTRFDEFEKVCKKIPSYLQEFILNKISINELLDFFVTYLSAYNLIARDAVLSPDNYHLSSSQFRNLDCFKELILFPIIYKDGLPDRISYLEPTALHNIINTIEISRALYKKEKVTIKDSIVYDILLNKTQKRFYRDFIYNKEAYNIFPCYTNDNTYQSDLKVIARDKLSSVKKVNISSIFDKIASFIKEKIELNKDNLSLNISLVGLIEKEEIEKLSTNILNWYAMLEDSKPKLSLLFTTYSNNNSDDIVINDRENSCRICYKPSLINKEKMFSIQSEIKPVVNSSDITFVLNCPWLKHENFDMLQGSSIHSFGEWLQDYDYKMKKYNKKDIHSLNGFINSSGIIRDVVLSYVRMNACDTQRNCEIMWVFSSELYKKIKEIIKNSQGEKLLYIYLSDDIIDYSYYDELVTGVILKSIYDIEYHYGNLFYVIKESNRKEKILPAGENADFVIPLSGFIERIPINYRQLQESLNISLNSMDFDIENVCRNIYIVGIVGNKMESLKFDIRLGPALTKFDDKTKEKLLRWGTIYCKALLEELKPFDTVDLYKKYCSDKTLFYKNTILKTFMDLIHDYAQSIKTLIFYERLIDIRYFNTTFSPKYNLQPIKESFIPVTADKRIYDLFVRYRNFTVKKGGTVLKLDFENIATERLLSACPDNYDYGNNQYLFDDRFKKEEKIFEYYMPKIIEAFEELGYTDYHDKIKMAKEYLKIKKR